MRNLFQNKSCHLNFASLEIAAERRFFLEFQMLYWDDFILDAVALDLTQFEKIKKEIT